MRVERSFSTGSVTSKLHESESTNWDAPLDVGGLVGLNRGSVRDSYSRSNVDYDRSWQPTEIGGLVGVNDKFVFAYQDNGNLRTQSVTGTVVDSYATGTGALSTLVADNKLDTIYVVSSYWNTNTGRDNSDNGGEGESTTNLRTPTGATGIYASWDADVWDFGSASEYPALKGHSITESAQRALTTAGGSSDPVPPVGNNDPVPPIGNTEPSVSVDIDGVNVSVVYADGVSASMQLRIYSGKPSYLPSSLSLGDGVSFDKGSWRSNPRTMTFAREGYEHVRIRWQVNGGALTAEAL